jgi:hypothetical protein
LLRHAWRVLQKQQQQQQQQRVDVEHRERPKRKLLATPKLAL